MKPNEHLESLMEKLKGKQQGMIEDLLRSQMDSWIKSLPPLPPGWVYDFIPGEPKYNPETNACETTMKAMPRQMYISRNTDMEKDYTIGKDALEFFFGLIGVFNHYSFFTEKLWKKVDGFKDKDEGEVKCAFMSLWTNHALGISTYPVGSAWCNYHGDRESFDKYMDEWIPLFMAFKEWANKQR